MPEEYIGDPTKRNVPAITKRFQRYDSNQDGKLTLDELNAMMRVTSSTQSISESLEDSHASPTEIVGQKKDFT